MPQVPLFVSSSQAEGAAQNGSFNVRFQPPLRVPQGAVNTTITFRYGASDRSLTQEEVNERHLAVSGALEARFQVDSNPG